MFVLNGSKIGCALGVGRHSHRQMAPVICSSLRERGGGTQERRGDSLISPLSVCSVSKTKQRVHFFFFTTPHIWSLFSLYGQYYCSSKFSIQFLASLSMLFLSSLRLCAVFIILTFTFVLSPKAGSASSALPCRASIGDKQQGTRWTNFGYNRKMVPVKLLILGAQNTGKTGKLETKHKAAENHRHAERGTCFVSSESDNISAVHERG